MKKLSHITIGGIKFKIQYVTNLHDDGVELHGDTNVHDRVIRINASDPAAAQAQTLFHECIHAAWYVTGHTENMTQAFEEALTLALDNMLWPVLPQLVNHE